MNTPDVATDSTPNHEWLSPSYTFEYPLVVERGEGCTLWDVNGQPYLDMMAGLASCSTGHSHPDVVQAIQAQASRFIHVSSSDFRHPLQAELAEALGGLCPWMEHPKVWFGCGGADVTEAALKLVRYHTKRPYVLGFYRGFHGRTFGAMSLTASKPVQREGFGAMLPGMIHAPYPYPLHESVGHPTTAQCVQFITRTLAEHYCNPSEIAAVFVEPIQGEGGYIPAPPEFLLALQAFCSTHGIIMVMDEVQSGMGRTGKWWGHQHTPSLEPDIVLSAKGIASGMPLSALIAPAYLMTWPPGSHANTFGANPLSCAASLATLHIIEQDVLPTLPKRASVFKHCLERLRERFPKVLAEVRGKGFMLGVEFVKDPITLAPNPELLHAVLRRLYTHHAIIAISCGRSTLRLCPPLVISTEELQRFTVALEECLETLLAQNA
jgi:4-aminobutyrate aminotransferase